MALACPQIRACSAAVFQLALLAQRALSVMARFVAPQPRWSCPLGLYLQLAKMPGFPAYPPS